MIRFKEFCENQLDENLVRNGSVAAYALQGKRHGDSAVQYYNHGKDLLVLSSQEKAFHQKLDRLAAALVSTLNGMIDTRKQLGAISAQVTASVISNRR